MYAREMYTEANVVGGGKKWGKLGAYRCGNGWIHWKMHTENYAKVGSKALNIHIVIGMILKTVPSRKEKLLQRDDI